MLLQKPTWHGRLGRLWSQFLPGCSWCSSRKNVQKCISTFLHVLSYPGLVSSSPTSENLVFAASLVSSSTFDHLRKCRLVRWQVAASHRRANVEKQRLYPETNTIKTLTLLYGLHIETHKKKKQHIPVWGELQKRTIPSAKSSMLNAEFHSQCRLARVSLSLCNNIFEINISFQSSGQQDMSLLDFRLR